MRSISRWNGCKGLARLPGPCLSWLYVFVQSYLLRASGCFVLLDSCIIRTCGDAHDCRLWSRKQSSSYWLWLSLQVNSLQKVIKLTKENLDKIEGQFLNVQHPPSIYFEVGNDELSVTRSLCRKCSYERCFLFISGITNRYESH